MEPMQEPMPQDPSPENSIKGAISRSRDVVCEQSFVVAEPDEHTHLEPFHLLRPTSDHRSLEFEPSGLRKLRALGPTCIISLVGSQRGGKSTLMNLLHSRTLAGFKIGHFMDPQTHGLWVWPRPHPRRPGTTVLLVDSEGLDSPHVPQHYNWLVSAVTLLISDVFMYQTKGSIEQSHAERLDMILRVAEQLGKAGGGGSSQLASCAFFWILRDHQLQMKHSPKEEMREKLVQGQVQRLETTFAEYDCVPFPRPAGADLLRCLDRATFQQLEQDFREEFVVFERRLLQLATEPREFLGNSFDGAALGELLQGYLESIKRQSGALGDICHMPTQLDLLKQLGSKRALDAGVRKYEELLVKVGLRGPEANFAASPAELLAGHASARGAAVTALEAEAAATCLSDDDLTACRGRLDDQLATWGSHVHPAAPHDVNLFAGDDHADVAPSLVRTPELQGGILKDLWVEHAGRSRHAYEAWIKNLLKPRRASVPRAGEEQAANEVLCQVQAHYKGLRDRLASAEQGTSGDIANPSGTGVTSPRSAQTQALVRIGPWAADLKAACGGAHGRELLLGVAQLGDELLASALRDWISNALAELRRGVAEVRAELLEKARADAAEEQRLLAEQLQSLREDAEEATRGTAQQLRQEMEEMKRSLLQSIRDDAAKERTRIVGEFLAVRKETASKVAESAAKVSDLEGRMLPAVASLQEAVAASEERAVERAGTLAKEQLLESFSTMKAVVSKALQDVEERARQRASEQEAAQVQQAKRVGALEVAQSQFFKDFDGRMQALREEQAAAKEALETSVAEGLQRAIDSAQDQALRSTVEGLQSELRACKADASASQEEVKQCAVGLSSLRDAAAAECEATAARVEQERKRVDQDRRDIDEKVAEVSSRVEMLGSIVAANRDKALAVEDRLKHEEAARPRLEQRLEAMNRAAVTQKEATRILESRIEAQVGGHMRMLDDKLIGVVEQLETMKSRNDLHTIWESFAHLSSEVNHLQVAVASRR